MILKHSKDNDIVFDGFMGSGTTPVACIETNRHYIGFEIDKNYFDIAKNRIDNNIQNKVIEQRNKQT